MEVSSHSLVQHRVAGIEFDTAIFTNLSRDHLDYHGDMYHYGQAKRQLFLWPTLKQRVINADGAFGQQLLNEFENQDGSYGYSLQSENSLAQVTISQLELNNHGINALVKTPWGKGELKSSLLGEFNVANLLALVTALAATGFALDDILSVIPQLSPAPGRMQHIKKEGFPAVIIDYAHTPAALEAALLAIKQHYHGKIFCIFGCGGDRDVGKRPMMGQVASHLSDYLIITNDNPRHEQPEAIVNDIIGGIAPELSYHKILDRGQAIQQAIEMAGHDAVVLIAGKGHEDYQQINDSFHHFSDYEQVMSAMGISNTRTL